MLTPSLPSASAALLAFASIVSSSPIGTRTNYEIKDSHYVPKGWTNIGRAPPNAVLNLHIGLKQAGLDELERQLYEGQRQCHVRNECHADLR